MNRLLLYIGPALRLLRRQRRMTQAEVARRASMTRQALSLYEHSYRSPSTRSLSRVLDALGVRLIDLARAVEEVEQRSRR